MTGKYLHSGKYLTLFLKYYAFGMRLYQIILIVVIKNYLIPVK